LDLQENINKQVKKAFYRSAGEVGRGGSLGDSSIDIILEVQKQLYVVSDRLHFAGVLSGIKLKHHRKLSEASKKWFANKWPD
jgi:hypothetical protein